MYAIYKQNKFEAEYENKHEVILYSRVKFKDFQNYISPWGRKSDNVFTKNVKMEELDYLYSIHYVEKDWFEIKPSANQNQIKDELGFRQINKLEWAKEISRKDIEVLKIVETPLGIFKDIGAKVKSLEGQDIDKFLNSIEK